MARKTILSRRQFVGAAAAVGATAFVPKRLFAASPTEIVHWSWLAASDGEVWQKMIDAFNEAHKDKGVQIKMEVVPEEQYVTKLLAAVATGRGPDFGWGTAGQRAKMAKEGVIVPLDDLAKGAGLDLSDFSEFSIKQARYPQYNNGLFMIPMDLMSLQPEVNTDHLKEAGLDPDKFPQDGAGVLDWAGKMTKRKGDKVVRSGIMMTASGVQPTVTWGIVSAQMGFRRASDDLKQAAVNPDAGIAAMHWVLDLFDKLKVSTRDTTDRYKAFGTGQGSIFWTGPWTLNGYVNQRLPFRTYLFPKIGAERKTYFEMGGMEFYKQTDTGRYKATMDAVKWLSDNSFLWTTVGHGATPRKSILNRPDYKTAGHPWEVRGAFVDGMSFATEGEIPVQGGPNFTIYSGGNFLAKTLETVWAGQAKPAEAMAKLRDQWQNDLDAEPAARPLPPPPLMAQSAGTRIALIIGNSIYASVTSLRNPKNDAELMARTLGQVEFQVTKVIDADQVTMKRAMLAFSQRLRAGADVGLFYYSGHGVQTRGRNYLIPIDALVKNEDELPIEAIDIDEFLAAMDNTGCKLNIIVLDACRNNPFPFHKGGTRGLSMVNAPSEFYVAYSTALGSVAEDGDGDDSPYTESLAQAILMPGLSLEQTFREVNRVVKQRTGQVPWESSSVSGEFFFRPVAVGAH